METFMAQLRVLHEQFITLSNEDQTTALAAIAEAVTAMRYAVVQHRLEKEVEFTLACEAEKMMVERMTSDCSSLSIYTDISPTPHIESALTPSHSAVQKQWEFIWPEVYEDNSFARSEWSISGITSATNLESTSEELNHVGNACNRVVYASSSERNEVGNAIRHVCATCGYLATNRKALYRHGLKTRHILRVTKFSGCLVCTLCPYRTDKTFNYNRHMKRFHPNERWELLGNSTNYSTSNHTLEESGPVSKTRKRCVGCYKNLAKENDSKTAAKRAKRINTRCSQCKKHFCLDCFNNSHRRCKL